MPKIRLYGEISQKHEADFLFLKGVYGCKNNGDILEIMIDKLVPATKKEIGIKDVKR